MSFSSRVARPADAYVQRMPSASERDHAGARNVQLKRALVGKDFASQEAALSPERGVQMKDARTGGAWTLEELGTAPGGAHSASTGAKEGGKPAPIGPSVEQIVQDAYTLGGQSRYQVTPQEAMRWVEDHMRNALPEHKYAFIEAMKRINKRL
jgi:hypothetical protein